MAADLTLVLTGWLARCLPRPGVGRVARGIRLRERGGREQRGRPLDGAAERPERAARPPGAGVSRRGREAPGSQMPPAPAGPVARRGG